MSQGEECVDASVCATILTIAVDGASVFTGCPSLNPILVIMISQEHFVPNLFRFGTNVHLESRMNVLEVGAKWLRSLRHHNYIFGHNSIIN